MALSIEEAQDDAIAMVRRMEIFNPKLPELSDDEEDIEMIVPKFTDEEVLAFEVFWQKHPLNVVNSSPLPSSFRS